MQEGAEPKSAKCVSNSTGGISARGISGSAIESYRRRRLPSGPVGSQAGTGKGACCRRAGGGGEQAPPLGPGCPPLRSSLKLTNIGKKQKRPPIGAALLYDISIEGIACFDATRHGRVLGLVSKERGPDLFSAPQPRGRDQFLLQIMAIQ